MAMVDRYIQKARAEFKVRPIFPFGLALTIGMVGVLTDGEFVIRGTAESILGAEVGSTTPPGTGEDHWLLQSGRDVKTSFVPAGQASALFPQLPAGDARVELSFGRDDSYLCAVDRPRIVSLADPAGLIGAIAAAYQKGAWEPDFVLVYQLVTAEGLLVLGSKTKDTSVLLSAGADLGVAGASVARLSADLKVMAQSQEIIRFDSKNGAPAFFNGYRVKKSFFSGATVERFSVDDDLVSSVFAKAT